MNFAFDYGNVLSSNTAALAIAHSLAKDGHNVHVISAVGSAYEKKLFEEHIRSMPVQWASVNFVGHGNTSQETGTKKANKMAEIGATVLFDDTPGVCDVVQARGFTVFKVGV